ncbi:ImpA family metalloprotease [Aeromonas sp. 600724]|uniref:ImpA family metalloprotease n=1 Tax=Aeromonas sp. 600724 TaxID=2712031 RepID=UPI003BA26170
MKKTVLTPLLALLITGCGGGDGEQEETPIRPPVTPNYFEASSQSSAGGQLNPTSLRLAAGEQGRFSVQADSGYLLTGISGCDGTLDGLTYTTGPMRSDCQISASFTQESAAVYFNATTQASQGGALSPDALRLNADEQGRFTVQPESGFVLTQIAGCEGTLTGNTYTTAPMRADCQISARFISDAANAIAREDHTLASEQSLIAHARAAIADSEAHRTELVRSLYQGMAQISWNPSHDSITFSSFQPESTVTLLPSNINGKGESEIRGLVMVSEQADYRQAAMGANLFSVDRTAQSEALLKGLIGWLTRGKDSDGLRILTAQMPSRADSVYFPHNEGVRDWLKAIYPDKHSINPANTCDYQALSDCIDTMAPELIVISDIDRQGLGYQGIAQGIAKAKAAGIPLLLSNYRRDASPLLSPLYLDMGLVTWGNYWSKLRASDLAVNTIMAPDAQLMAVDTLLGNLQDRNFTTQWLDSCGGNFINCGGSESFNQQFKLGADWLRNGAITLDKAGISPFAREGATLLPATLLLADKYRAAIDYPIAWDEHQSWQQAMFADWLVSYARTRTPAQPDLGEYVTDRSKVVKGQATHYAYPATLTDSRRIAVPYSGQWTTTGWYALPGQTITLRRTDNADVSATVRLNYHRPNTNRAYEQKIYRAPLELTTGRLILAKGGSVTFTSPYGGPIYLYLEGGAASLAVQVSATGVTRHPAIMDFSDEQQIREFNERLEQTELPHIDLRADGAEQHLRRDRFTKAVGGVIPDTNALLDSIARDHINGVYTLAGLKIQGKGLDESLPADVKNACVALLGEGCLDESIHTRTIIQHANYDQNAHCGSGCSGNPWDSSGSISPTGWLDNHELGHNLQTNRLNVQYAAADDADNWSGYGSRAGENSNNIFPYVVKWRAHYLRDGNTAPIKDGHMNHKDLFYVFMSDAAQVRDRSGNRVVLGANCKVLDTGESRYEAPWKSNAYAVHNGYRMAFYIQMALRAHRMLLTDGTRLNDGFTLFTLLYQHSRIFGAAADSEAQWNANKDRLGFSLFPYSGHAVYGGKRVRDIPGNDFMLVALSRLTGWDWRNHFDLLGLRYSSLAVAQVQANQRYGSLPMGMYVLEDDLPPANMSEGVTFLPLSESDGSTLWPRNSGSPSACPTP